MAALKSIVLLIAIVAVAAAAAGGGGGCEYHADAYGNELLARADVSVDSHQIHHVAPCLPPCGVGSRRGLIHGPTASVFQTDFF